MKFRYSLILAGAVLYMFMFFVAPAQAAIVPDECLGDASTDVNRCGLTELLQVGVNITDLILAVTGSAAMLMFVYGGVLWIISQGSSEKIEQGKNAIVASVVGIAIILSAWLMVNTIIWGLTGGEVGNLGKIAEIFGKRFNAEPDLNVQDTSPNTDTTAPNQPGSGSLDGFPL